MKRLSDSDIERMANDEFSPNHDIVRRGVRAELKLSELIPAKTESLPKHVVLDLHHKTEEQAWNEIMRLATSGARNATIITGASGILKIKFQQWAQESLLSPYIISVSPLNNGSFAVKFKRIKN